MFQSGANLQEPLLRSLVQQLCCCWRTLLRRCGVPPAEQFLNLKSLMESSWRGHQPLTPPTAGQSDLRSSLLTGEAGELLTSCDVRVMPSMPSAFRVCSQAESFSVASASCSAAKAASRPSFDLCHRSCHVYTMTLGARIWDGPVRKA